MILTLLRYPKLNKLNSPFSTVHTKLQNGEQYLIQTVDKKLALTTHRLILKPMPWTYFGQASVNLEDIQGWEIKATGKTLYSALSLGLAFMGFFDTSFILLSSFFLVLYIMTRHRRVHVITQGKSLILPLEVEEKRIEKLIEMVRTAKHARQSQFYSKVAA